MDLAKLRVIVTGAASGLGASATKFLLDAGASVAALDVNQRGLQRLHVDCGRPAGLLTYVADISVESEVVRAVTAITTDMGPPNALINFAGIYLDGLLVHSRAIKMPLAQWRRVIDVDLTGAFLVTREVAAAMIDSATRPGVIIHVSSISRHGNVGQSPYSAAKAAVVADTRLWARELAPHGIRVAAISPGLIDTPILRGLAPEKMREYLERIPLRRLGRPEEINSAVRFVVECEYFTGECVEVNGGFLF